MRHTEQSDNGIIQGVIWKQLLIFFFPILLGIIFQQLYSTLDAVVVGRFVGKQALAAVGGSTGTLINLPVSIFTGLSSGAAVMVSQYFGARRYTQVGRTVHTSVALTLACGLGITVLGLAVSEPALRAMGTPEEIMPASLTYIRIYFAGITAILMYNMGSGILRAMGDARRPLYFLIATCLANIGLDFLLVVWLRLGVEGVAIATVLSQALGAVLVLAALSRVQAPYRLVLRKLRFIGGILRRVVTIGLPVGLQSLVYAASNIFVQRGVNSFGTDTIAAWTAYGRIDGLYWLIMGAFAVSVTTFAGQNFGACQYDRIHKTVRICLAMAVGVTLTLSAVLCAANESIFRLFTTDTAVIEIGARILRLLVPLYFTYVCIEIFAGAVRGTGDTLIPMIITCLGVGVIRIVWILVVAPLWHDVRAVLVSYPITWALTSVIFVIYYLRGGWLRRRIADSERLSQLGDEKCGEEAVSK